MWEQFNWARKGSTSEIHAELKADIVLHLPKHSTAMLEHWISPDGGDSLSHQLLCPNTSDKEELNLGPLTGNMHGQEFSSIEPPTHPAGHFQQSPCSSLQMLILGRGKDHTCLVEVIIWFHSPNLHDGMGNITMTNDLLLLYTIIVPTTNQQIKKQLRQLLRLYLRW